MISRSERANLLRNFVPGYFFVFKLRRELWHPKYARKVSRVSRNACLVLWRTQDTVGHDLVSNSERVPWTVDSTATGLSQEYSLLPMPRFHNEWGAKQGIAFSTWFCPKKGLHWPNWLWSLVTIMLDGIDDYARLVSCSQSLRTHFVIFNEHS